MAMCRAWAAFALAGPREIWHVMRWIGPTPRDRLISIITSTAGVGPLGALRIAMCRSMFRDLSVTSWSRGSAASGAPATVTQEEMLCNPD